MCSWSARRISLVVASPCWPSEQPCLPRSEGKAPNCLIRGAVVDQFHIAARRDLSFHSSYGLIRIAGRDNPNFKRAATR